jgi:hypothetical protein
MIYDDDDLTPEELEFIRRYNASPEGQAAAEAERARLALHQAEERLSGLRFYLTILLVLNAVALAVGLFLRLRRCA